MAKGTVVWTPEEDQQLKKLVSKFGEKKWATIASHFDRKVSKQCRRRWQNVLNANLKQGSWTADEDNMLLELHKKLGNKWVEMTRVIKGRTDNAVKNRFIALTRKCAYRERSNLRKEFKSKAPATNKSGVLSHTAKPLSANCNSMLTGVAHGTFSGFPAPPEPSISQSGSPQSLCEGLDESSPSSIVLNTNVKAKQAPSKAINIVSTTTGGLGGAHDISPHQFNLGSRQDSIHAQQLAWLQNQFLHSCSNRFFIPVQIPWPVGQPLTQFSYPGSSVAAAVGFTNGPANSTSHHFNEDALPCGTSSFSNIHIGTSNLLRQLIFINSGMMKFDLQKNQ